MRKIKFRGWIPDLGHEQEFPKRGHMFEWKLNWESQGVSEAEKHGTVMQFTGLLDKNGKEIYEGDVLKCWETQDENKEFAEIGKVYWRELTTSWVISNIERTLGDIERKDLQSEIIGNIYSNPELLN